MQETIVPSRKSKHKSFLEKNMIKQKKNKIMGKKKIDSNFSWSPIPKTGAFCKLEKMITIVWSLIAFLSVTATRAFNPVKLTCILLLLSSAMFLCISLTQGPTWFPIIFFILFVGGILVMFIILSSTIPNEKASKFKIKLMAFTIFSFILRRTPAYRFPLITQSKWAFLDSQIAVIITLIILVYFFSFLKIVSTKKTPMRKLNCYKWKVL